MIENKFNLIDESWVPTDKGLKSLKEIFSDFEIKELCCNPIEKISLLKFFLSIVQVVWAPEDENEVNSTSLESISEKILKYFDDKKDLFYLYGEKPFLQFPRLLEFKNAKETSYTKLIPHISTSCVVYETQNDYILKDYEKALLLINLMGYALGGKKHDPSLILSKNSSYEKKTMHSGCFVGSCGQMHNFVLFDSLFKTLFLNVFTKQQINENFKENDFSLIPLWEKMPESEDCEIAQNLRKSYLGKLIPLNVFVYFKENSMIITEGINSFSHKEGSFNPTNLIDKKPKEPKVKYVDPLVKSWRFLPSFLSFLKSQNNESECRQIEIGYKRAIETKEQFKIWSGGLKVSNSTGEFFVTNLDDFVDSYVELDYSIKEEIWVKTFEEILENLEFISNTLRKSIDFFCKKTSKNQLISKKAKILFWAFCDKQSKKIIEILQKETLDKEKIEKITKEIKQYAHEIYDKFCFPISANQIDAWASSKPNFNIKTSKKEKKNGRD